MVTVIGKPLASLADNRMGVVYAGRKAISEEVTIGCPEDDSWIFKKDKGWAVWREPEVSPLGSKEDSRESVRLYCPQAESRVRPGCGEKRRPR